MKRGIDSIGDFIFMDDKLEIVSGSNNSKLKNNMTEADFLEDIAI